MLDELNKLEEEATPTEDELFEMLSKGDHQRAMAWLLFLPRTQGIPLVSRELMGDLLALQMEIMRLYRVEDRYKKLMEQTKDFRKAKKIDRKSKAK